MTSRQIKKKKNPQKVPTDKKILTLHEPSLRSSELPFAAHLPACAVLGAADSQAGRQGWQAAGKGQHRY
jgi:hypothetical protein